MLLKLLWAAFFANCELLRLYIFNTVFNFFVNFDEFLTISNQHLSAFSKIHDEFLQQITLNPTYEVC
jgi:hypothetical protein